ncbi:MAG: cell division protein CrgA [Actinomycetes bacterium]
MARHGTSSRTTPKGNRKGASARPAPGSNRLTPKKPNTDKRPSRLWVPVAMFTFLGLGLVVIMANYLGLLPGGTAQNSDLVLGLALLVGGFVMSTQLR